MAIGLQDPVLGEPVMRTLQGQLRACADPLLLAQAGHFVPEQGEALARWACEQFARP
jgi:tRNA(adenine34) deaminase